MHFHSNSKFRFNQKFHSFINAPLKKKEQKIKIHAFKHAFSKFIFNKKFSCIHKCIKQKIKFHAFLYEFFKNNKIKNSYSNKFHVF